MRWNCEYIKTLVDKERQSFLSVRKIALKIGITEHTLWKMRNKNHMPGFRSVVKFMQYFSIDDINEMVIDD